ncbi:uncharacterized protein LOC107039139 [Diachasma alloeum]|uniref:uncharacterized protein LOC107039139 n=1 Tax=Diachasma alloeum TaxID=454923 RepID=UPI0007381BE7|nr:uncharacterized protein LOC107039139 [Diachasma alloeum]
MHFFNTFVIMFCLWVDVQLTYRRDQYVTNGFKEWWEKRSEGTVDLCDMTARGEGETWGELVREAIGMEDGCPVDKGKVKVDKFILSGGRCRPLEAVSENWSTKHKINLNLIDEDGNKLLTGGIATKLIDDGAWMYH